jgi:hypothetical protein
MAQLAVNVVPLNGIACRALLAAAGTPASGDTAPTGTGVFLLVENTGGTACVVTIPTPGTFEGDLSPLPSRVATAVPITTGLNIIPLTDAHRDPATGLATINYSFTTGVKAICVRVP